MEQVVPRAFSQRLAERNGEGEDRKLIQAHHYSTCTFVPFWHCSFNQDFDVQKQPREGRNSFCIPTLANPHARTGSSSESQSQISHFARSHRRGPNNVISLWKSSQLGPSCARTYRSVGRALGESLEDS